MPTNWEKLGKCVEAGGEGTETTLKVVIFDEEDYAYAREVAEHFPEIPMYLQVGNDVLEGDPDVNVLLGRYVWLSEKVLDDGWNNATVLPQLHVLAHGNRRGV